MPNESKAEEQASPDKSETTGSSPNSTSLSGPRPLTAKDLPEGTLVDGKYRIESLLGQGGMGVVMAAEHLQLRERVALKFLRVEEDVGQGFKSRFRREAQICAKIKNEHITRVIDVGSYQDAEYMVMEYLDGTDLRGFIRSRRNDQLSPEEAIALAVQACEGLAEVHARGIVHRDLKPSNLFIVRRSDGTPLVKILDFGISKWGAELDAQEDELTKTGAVLGSPKYMAPEQLFGSHTVDARADVWSVGAITYELLTGKPPFEEPTFARLCARLAAADPPRRAKEVRADLSDELDAAVMLCLERNIDQRIPNVAQLAGELLHAIGDPTAEVVRTRLMNILAGGGSQTGELMAASMRSGEWVKASLSLGRTGSNPSGTISLTGTNPGSQSGGSSISAAGQAQAAAPAEQQKSKTGLFIAIAAVLLIVIFAITRMGGQPDAKPGTQPTASATAPSTPGTGTATATNSAATGTPTSTGAPTATTAAPTVTASAEPTATAAPVKNWGKPNKPTATAAPTPTPTVTAAPTPTPTVTAAPTPTPAKPNNPLEDRQ